MSSAMQERGLGFWQHVAEELGLVGVGGAGENNAKRINSKW